MSISEFSAALKNKAVKEWFNKEKFYSKRDGTVNTLVNPTSLYRSAEQTAQKTSFYITKDTIKSLLIELKGITDTGLLETEADRLFREFGTKNAGVKVRRRKIKVGNDLPAIYFSNISFDSITNLVNTIVGLNPGELATKFEKGHVVGLNTELLRQTASRMASEIDGRAAEGAVAAKHKILAELDSVIEYYKKLDFDSANLQPAADIKIYARINKKLTRTGSTSYLVELQPKAINQGSAAEVKRISNSIRKLFSPGALTEKQMVETIDALLSGVQDATFADALVNLKSSPDFKQMVANLYIASLHNKEKDQVFNVAETLITSQKVKKADLTELRKVIKQEAQKVQELRKKIAKKAKPLRLLSGRFTSPASLQVLINATLADRIKANMGAGDRKDILNLRTGRFAESVEVKRVTASREGMITAFYTYMKNPYATFSAGGRQQYPKSRDPKLLISRTIREIVTEKMDARLRAVLV